jgi:hypothetical protein
MAEGAATRGAPPAGWDRCRVLLYLLLGLLVVDAMVHAHRGVWRRFDPNEYRERLRRCRKRAHDLVLVGGSPVSEGLDPAVLAGLDWHGRPLRRVYNLGLPGATTSEVWHATKHGLVAPPRLLVYGITASDLNDARHEPQGPRELMDVADVAAWVGEHPDSGEWCLRHFLAGRLDGLWQLYHHRNGIRLWAADRVGRLWPGAFPEAVADARAGYTHSAAIAHADGYAPDPAAQMRSLQQLKSTGNLGQPFHFLEQYRLGGHVRYLERFLDWADGQGVSLVLLDMPVSADLEDRRHPREFARFRKLLAEVERRRGVPVLHATRAAVGLGDAEFADLIHLNAKGTARLSTWLRRELEEYGASPGR